MLPTFSSTPAIISKGVIVMSLWLLLPLDSHSNLCVTLLYVTLSNHYLTSCLCVFRTHDFFLSDSYVSSVHMIFFFFFFYQTALFQQNFLFPGTGLMLGTCMYTKSHQSCLTVCDSMDWSPPGSSVHGILQARMLEWVAMPSRIFLTKGWNPYISCFGRWVLYL